MSLTAQDVKMGYSLLLGRTASEAEIQHMLSRHSSIASLRSAVLNSAEFFNNNIAPRYKALQARPGPVIHIHIPKAGGSSLGQALDAQEHLKPGRSFTSQAPYAALPEAERKSLRLIRGHLNMNMDADFDQRPRYICVIRKPAERIFSYYRYISRTVTHPAHSTLQSRDMSFGDYLEFSKNNADHRLEIDNGQIRRLSGNYVKDSKRSAPDCIRNAIHNVFRPETILGYAEHMESLGLKLHAAGILSSPEIGFENVAPQGSSCADAISQLTPVQAELLNEFTIWDQYFYDLCIGLIPPKN